MLTVIIDMTNPKCDNRVVIGQLLFKVIGRDGSTYEIYTSGETRGFEPDAVVLNFYPQFLAGEMARRHFQQETQCSTA